MKRRIQKRARSTNIHTLISSSAQTTQRKTFLDSLREVTGIITAATGVSVVLLYLMGRSIAAGYFEAMNIPSYLISLSLWEYGEQGWIIILLPVGFLLLWGSVMWIISVAKDMMSPISSWISNRWGRTLKKTKIRLNFPAKSQDTHIYSKFTGNMIYITTIMAVLIFLIQEATNFGKILGESHVLENSAQIELVSTNLMYFENTSSSALQPIVQGAYVYQGFHLATFNNGKYYLFKEIDPNTCKPHKIYIVEPDPNTSVNSVNHRFAVVTVVTVGFSTDSS